MKSIPQLSVQLCYAILLLIPVFITGIPSPAFTQKQTPAVLLFPAEPAHEIPRDMRIPVVTDTGPGLTEIFLPNEEAFPESEISEPVDVPLATRTASVSGNWSNTATWGGQAVPTSADAVIINSGVTVTVDVLYAQCLSLQMNMPAIGSTNTLNVSATGTLTCGSLTMLATVTPRNNYITISGAMVVSGTTTTGTSGCQISFSGAGGLALNGNLTGSPAITTFSGCSLNIGFSTALTSAQSAAIITVAGSNFNYTGNSSQTIYARTYGGNLGLSGSGTKTIAASASVIVSGNLGNYSTLTLTAGTSTTSTILFCDGNFTNSGTFNATADYTTLYFDGLSSQTFTNNGTVTAPIYSMSISNNAGLTMAGSNQVPCRRVNLFYGMVANSNKITLGNGGTTTGVVQIGASTSNAAGSFDQAPQFNAGTDGYQLLYSMALNDYSTSYEIPPDGVIAYLLVVCTPRTVTLSRDITIADIYTTGLNLSSGNLSIGANTLTVIAPIGVVSGTLTGGTSSNIVFPDSYAITLPAVAGGLNHLTLEDVADITLGGAVTVNGTLNLAGGVLNNGTNLTMATGSTIARSRGSVISAPAFAGTVNLNYSGGDPVVTGKEMPPGASTLNNLTSSASEVIQYDFSTGSTELLTEPFPNLNSWTGNKGTASGQFNTVSSANAGGISPEARFYGTFSHPAVSTTYSIYRGTVNTTGYSNVSISFKTKTTGNYTQNFPTSLKLQTSTTSSGPWNDAWSVAYAVLAAQTITISNYTTDVGEDMYVRFALVGDGYATDYWYFDDLVVNGINITPVAFPVTVNGSFNLQEGIYTIGSINSMTVNGSLNLEGGLLANETNLTMASGTTIGRSGGKLAAQPSFGASVNVTYTGADSLQTGYEIPVGATVLNNLTANPGGVAYDGTPSPGTVTTLYSQGFNGAPAGWTTEIITNTGTLADPAIGYVTAAGSTYPSVVPTEGTECAEFNSYDCDAGDKIRLKMTNPVTTTGKRNISVVFDWHRDNIYINPDSVMVQWSVDGTNWNNSFGFFRYNSASGWITLHSLLPAGAENQPSLYVALMFLSEYGNNCHLDNFRIEGTSPGAFATATATVNGTMDLTVGSFAIGAGNTLTLNGGLSGNSSLTGGASSNMTVGGSAPNLTLPMVVNGLNNFTITRPAGVTIAPDRNLTVTGTLTNSSGNTGLTLASDASGTGSLKHNTAGIPATVQRYIPGASWSWHQLSSPVSAQPINPAFTTIPTNEYDFFAWHEPTDTWVNFKNSSVYPTWNDANGSNNFVNGKGYLVDYLALNPVKEYAGNLNNGAVSPALTKTGAGVCENYNLVGNPYPSAIDWKAAGGWDRAALEMNSGGYQMSVWNDAVGQYGSFNSAGTYGTNGVSQYIPVGQGFMVKAASAGTLGMNNSIRVHASQSFLKSDEITPDGLRLRVTGTATPYSDEVVIEFGHSLDQGGAEKLLSFYENAPSLFTVKPTGRYAVDFRGQPGAMTIPVSFMAGADGNYTLTASQLELFTGGTVIMLEDLQTGTTQNLVQNPQHTFSAVKTDNAERFLLHFGGTYSVNDKSNSLFLTIYSAGNQVYIENTSNKMLKGGVTVYNMMGQPVLHRQLTGTATMKFALNAPTGYYLVKVVTDEFTYTGKVFIH